MNCLKNRLMRGVSALVFVASSIAVGDTVEFHIKPGTHNAPWNTPSTTLVVKLGTTVRIVNDDDERHLLHTPLENHVLMAQRIFFPGVTTIVVLSISVLIARWMESCMTITTDPAPVFI